MANVVIPNFSPISISTVNDAFSIIWKLSRAMKAAGWVYKSSSDGTTKDTTGTATNDKWGGNANPLLDTYPSFPGGNTSAQAWWNAQGPSTLKIPIGAAQVSGTYTGFIRGENISQATTGAQGEIIGYLFDGYAQTGFLVALPRVDGSGADPHGWDHTNVITGSASGATVTPNATIIEFVREIVFWKDATLTNLTHYVQCVDGYSESTSRFSVLAGSAGCTGSVAPAGGGTGNTFPAVGSYTAGGTGGSQSANAIGLASGLTQFWDIAKVQIIAVNATYSNGVSADGTFIFAAGAGSNSSAAAFPEWNYYLFQGFVRVDNQEDGDVDPYVSLVISGDLLYAGPAASGKLADGSTNILAQAINGNWNLGGRQFFRMWRRRGFSSNDAFVNGGPATLQLLASGSSSFNTPISTPLHDRDRAAYAFTETYIGEDMWAINSNTNQKIRKGVLRWVRIIGGNVNDAYGFNNLRSWIAISSNYAPQGGNGGPCGYLIGPWDGTSITATQ